MLKYLLTLVLLNFGAQAFALPEIARYGHLTCVSCHVSPSGGGMLTSSGRTFSLEKLSTWRSDGEEDPLHGLIPVSDTFLMGGDIRWADYRTYNSDANIKKFWRMQTDLQVGLHVDKLWVSATAGNKPAGPFSKPNNRFLVRNYEVRHDFFDEHMILRAGLFIPKFGLMLADHTAYVRNITGLGPDTEQSQIEAIYQNDALEVALAGLIPDEHFERKGKAKSGFNSGVSIFLKNRHRLNLNVMSTKLAYEGGENTMTTVGTSGTFSITRRIFALIELDQVSNTATQGAMSTTTKSSAEFINFGFETYRGIVPYTRFEYMNTDLSQSGYTTQRWGMGINLYPRPHFEVEARAMRAIASASKSTVDESDVILHYYF